MAAFAMRLPLAVQKREKVKWCSRDGTIRTLLSRGDQQSFDNVTGFFPRYDILRYQQLYESGQERRLTGYDRDQM